MLFFFSEKFYFSTEDTVRGRGKDLKRNNRIKFNIISRTLTIVIK